MISPMWLVAVLSFFAARLAIHRPLLRNGLVICGLYALGWAVLLYVTP